MSALSRNWNRITFALAVLALAGAATFIQIGKVYGYFTLIKKPLPIRRPLKHLDRSCVRPYIVDESPALSADVISELGTEEYVNWILIDPRQRSAARQRVTTTVTYYTGVQDQLPHVPEECMFQGAFAPAGDEKLTWDLKELGQRVAVRRLEFYPPRQTSKRTIVYYTLCVNGDFYNDRQFVRLRMGDKDEKYLYYSKVEIDYPPQAQWNFDELDARTRDLLEDVLLELRKSHWPPMEAVKGQ